MKSKLERIDEKNLEDLLDALSTIATMPFDGQRALEKFGVQKLDSRGHLAAAIEFFEEIQDGLEFVHLIPETGDTIDIPLKGGQTCRLSPEQIKCFEGSYPGLDVRAELARISAWNKGHRSRRKTPRGIFSHINSWLSRAAKEQREDSKRGLSAKERVALARQQARSV